MDSVTPPNPQGLDYDSQSGTRQSPIYIVSGSIGLLGEQLASTVIPQFQGANVPLKMMRHVRDIPQIDAIVAEAVENKGTIIHTLVDAELRQHLVSQASQQNVSAIDVIGPLMETLTTQLGIEPLGSPGLYRKMHEDYFNRLQAIEYTLNHDDGKNYKGWSDAGVVIVGPSRVGKTPLSIYLSVMGWKAVNVPLVPGIPPRPELFDLDYRRVVGLYIAPSELLMFRQHRQSSLGVNQKSNYTDPAKIFEEVQAARQVYRKGGFKVINVTDKPIETTAAQVIAAVNRRMRRK